MTSITASEPAVTQYSSLVGKRIFILCIAAVLLLASFVYDIANGPGDFPLSTVLEILWDKTSHGVRMEVIVWDYRLPIAITAVLVGVMLSIAGAQMQTILNNPLAEPFTLGVSSAASFGASLAIVLGWSVLPNLGHLIVTMNAFLFALGTCAFILLAARLKGVGSETIILFGIAIFFVFNAALAMMQYMASEDQLSRIVFWMMGSLTRASWEKIGLGAALLAVVIPICMLRSWKLTALRMGEETALSMGVDVQRLRIEMLIIISILAATAVAFVGTIGFVGLVGPHIARMIVGEDQRYFLPLSALTGGLMMSLTSILSKMITPGILYPIGIITALIGVPVFISVILSTRKNRLS
ncbi:iron ABC transporter permease [Pseudovibrio sp. Tun.PSC04-5.I4]|uniref:FecCD family ABC transporter permease n=1 Tax=Pseudovibrio sp. Tun.PSC04-5.I4 TaxID=1798213 RepID=UPI00087FDB6F|nr:iron ABC transporter permease [Pseudovibrio sp. Tun.PSC04-5.I4]SDQ74232.1 iron complex transport system permease protein [Pseudovibrio sp. Tun.PSC04-5.I4]